MVKESKKSIRIDLNLFKLHIHLKPDIEMTLHFNSPSRRFYLAVIALVVHEMKKRGKIISIPLCNHIDTLALLNETVGGAAGSSKKEYLLRRVYRKWKEALPDLENAPLFKVIGKKKRFDEQMDKVYEFGEGEKDIWANLFEYMGSHENVRLRFSIDRLGASLDDVIVYYGESLEKEKIDAWEKFISQLEQKQGNKLKPGSVPEPHASLFNNLPETFSTHRYLLMFACLVGLVSGFALYMFWDLLSFTHPTDFAPDKKITSHPVGKPSIAVLPFRNLSDDPAQDYFSDGITDDIITDLSKLAGLWVISRHSSFAYKKQDKKIPDIAKELKVRYVLEGSVRRDKDKVRIVAQLIDAETDHHLWADRFDGNYENIFDLQDRITKRIVSALSIQLSAAEERNVSIKETMNMVAYEAFLKGQEHFYRTTPRDWIKALEYYEKAIKIDPSYSRVYAAIGYIYQFAMNLHWWDFYAELNISWQTARLKAVNYLNMAMKNPSFEAYSLYAGIEIHRRHYDNAIVLAEKGLALSPNNAYGNLGLGWILVFAGQPEKAIEYLEKALQLDPNSLRNKGSSTVFIGLAYFSMGQLEKAVGFLEKGLTINPRLKRVSCFLAASHALLGNQTEATKAFNAYKETQRGWFPSLQRTYHAWPFKNVEVFDRLAEGLIKSGLQEEADNYFKVVAKNKLKRNEIEKHIFARTKKGKFPEGRWWSTEDTEGNFVETAIFTDPAGNKREYRNKGKSWVEGDMGCSIYEKRHGGLKNCTEYYKNPGGSADTQTEYIGISYLKLFTFSVEE